MTTTEDRTADARHLIALYLDDHWAGAGAGIALARRIAQNNAEDDWGPRLAAVAEEIAEDEGTLRTVREAMGAEHGQVKRALAMAGERVGRVVPNGRVHSYSPLSRVLESEAMISAVTGKQLLWSSLRQLTWTSPLSGFDLAELERRSEAQIAVLREFHADAARRAFGLAD